MNTYYNYETSYKAAHRFIPTTAFESNVTSLDAGKESLSNVPNLKRWNYDTSTNISHDLKFNTMDPMQKPMRVNFDQMNYITPQMEKYVSNPPKPMFIPPTEYNDKFIQPKLMSNIDQRPIPIISVQSKFRAHKELAMTQTPKISDMGVVRKMDPYVSTQKLSYIEINPIIAKQINTKQPQLKPIIPEYAPFYSEPIFNRQNTIRLIPNTIKYIPHNAHKSEMSASYKTPINTLSKYDNVVQMPISISRNPTLSQILSVSGMYTSEYSKYGGNK